MTSRFVLSLVSALLLGCCADLLAQTPVPGQNINMVSGITLPTGDPYLQRQNEPSIAVSTRNPQHLLAGANDYRTVNLNSDTTPGQSVAADAWLGVFKSFDGSATWISNLLPGYPGDNSSAGLASPLNGLTTGSDPTVRSAPAGLFYFSSIAFNRNTNLGVVSVSRFMDLNNVESGDPIRFINTVVVDSGTSGQFLDKPWIAVGLPTGGTCTIQVPQANGTTVTQTVPAAPVYLLWSRFTGSTSTKIMFSQSTNCGATWSTPSKLSESNSINQGTAIAVGPTGSNIYVAWRRFATSSQPDAIVVATSTNAGKTFSKAIDAVDLGPFNSANPNLPAFFDQPSTSTTFRTNAFPTIAVDGSGRVYLAWSQRGLSTNGQARIAMSTSLDGTTWSVPFVVDNGPLDDRGINVLTTSFTTLTTGHQFMPQLAFTGGLLSLAYYDHREDHTVDLFTPNNPWVPDANGLFYSEALATQDCISSFSSSLCDPISAVFTPFISDAGLIRRHTIDLLVAQATPASQPTFVTARVSQYKYGLTNAPPNDPQADVYGKLQQLQFNPPDLPLFAQGTTPFIGDYIDVSGPNFVLAGSTWSFNTSAQPPIQYVTWTDNRDVRAPSDGNWAVFTPPGSPNCDPGHVADRNQNIYVSRVTQGLALSSPQNTKPLSTALQHAFVIVVQNFTTFDKTFRLTIASQPPGGYASFLPGTNNPPNPPTPPSPVTTTLDLQVAAHSGVSRPVFATSTNSAASITITATEISSLGGMLVSGGLSGFVVLNPDPSAAALNGLINTVETYDPTITNPIFDATVTSVGINGSLTNNGLPNGSLTNTELANGSLTNGSLTNGSLTNGSLTNGSLTNGSLTNGSLTNGSLTNGSLTNGSLTNGSLTNTTITDATYAVTNRGDTTSSYTVSLVGANTSTTGQSLQLIASKTYYTPFALDCTGVLQQPQAIVLANVDVPLVQPLTNGSLTNRGISNGSLTNMTLAVAPGDTIQITIRGLGFTPTQLQQVTQQLAPLVVAQASNTNDSNNAPKFALPLFINTSATAVPNGTVNTPYSTTTIQAIGGTAPYTWSVASGSLPSGLTLDTTSGALSGTPSAAGVFNFTLQVADASSPQNTAQLALSISIAKANTTTVITSAASPTLVGQPFTVSWNVTISPPAGSGPATPSGTVTVSDGNGASCSGSVPTGSCTLTPAATTASTFALTATYAGDSNFNGSNVAQSHTVGFYAFTGFLLPLGPAGTIASPTFSGTQNLGSAVPLKWQLTDLNGNIIFSLSSTISIQAVFTGSTCSAPVTGPAFVLYSPTAGATGGSTFRFSSPQFIFNWDTSTGASTGPGCYAVVLQLNDKSPAKVTEVQLK